MTLVLAALSFGPKFFEALVLGAVVLSALGVLTLLFLLAADSRNRRIW